MNNKKIFLSPSLYKALYMFQGTEVLSLLQVFKAAILWRQSFMARDVEALGSRKLVKKPQHKVPRTMGHTWLKEPGKKKS